MSYNFSNVTDFTGMLDVVNSNTADYFWVFMLVMVFFIILISLINWGIIPALLSSGFVGLIGGVMLYYADMIDVKFLYPFIGLIGLLFLYLLWANRDV